MQGHRSAGGRDSGSQVARRSPAQIRVVAAADNGNLQSQTIQIPGVLTNTQSYAYDGVNRLSTFIEAGAQLQTYGYDAYGNRWLTGGSFIPYSTQTPQSNNFTNNQWAPGGGVSYDLASNQTSLAVGSGARGFTYDAENRQITASIPGMPAIAYAYDGEGRRVQKTVGTTVTTYVYDAQGNLAAKYGGPAPSVAGTTYLTADHLGSTRLVTNLVNGSPNPVERYDYAPFGEELTAGIDGRIATPPQFYSTNQYPTIASDSLTVKFTGQLRDAETGLDFFNARYMSSAQGRFTSPDLLGGELANPQSLNRYTYALNNPLRFTDPTGLYVCKDDPKDGSSHCSSDQDKAFEKSLDALRNSKNGDVARAAAAYGGVNDANGVTVGFADLGKTGEGGVTRSTLGADASGKLFAQSDVTINSGSTGTAFSADIGHEGSHVADAQDMVRGITITGGGTGFTVGTDISQYASEQRAYRVTDSIYRSANEPYNGCGNANCALGAGSSPLGIGQRIDQILLANPQLYHSSDGRPLTQKNQGGNVLNLVVPH